MDKSYRIHTNIISDTLLNVNMQQDFDFLEVLSLKLRQKDAYRLHSSNYGVIVGRVLANDAFGIPNAKISVFIERDGNDSSDIESIYPYSSTSSKDKEGRRYNLLPDYSDDDCYRVVGTFPNKRLMLDDDIQLEIYDKYWKYTTVTNNAGDYMLFGVPTGSVTVHVDIDLSDIGVLSQKPRDFEYKGYNLTMFDNSNQFKESTNLDGLAQIFSQNKSVFVYPFWGDDDNGIASLTRSDIQIQYKFEPTCVFIGSIVSDNDGHAIGSKCAPDVDNGMNDQLVGGNGTIEMIRRTTDGLVEEYQIQGNQLIDENGVWCYQIPMNLDYIGTDEYGNVVPTDNPTKGIPTRTQVRFRISKNETNDEGFSRHTAKYLVPMNPIFSEESIVPKINVNGSDIEKMYEFGSSTPEHCFRDLYWNNVYSVKNYIPKVQVAHRAYSKNYSALKGANLAEEQNQIPFNKLRVDVPFTYIIICLLFTIVTYIVLALNAQLCVVHEIINAINKLINIIRKIPVVHNIIPPLDWLLKYTECISLSPGLNEGNTAFYPGCWCNGFGDCPEEMEGDCKKVGGFNTGELIDRVQRSLANEYKIVKLDFYQDWINGTLYMPLWYWRKRKKKTFLFGLFRRRAKNDFCSCDSTYSRLKVYTACEIPYSDNSFTVDGNIASEREERWHKNRAERIKFRRGLIRPFVNKDDLTIYYYSALQATINNANPSQALSDRDKNFYAIRLYATDIILLGNLIEDNLYGIPQFFKCLPQTTANIPAIATIEQEGNDDDSQVDVYSDGASESEDEGSIIITGMDWRRDRLSEKDSPNYKQGLFMDLGCSFADTKAKSCINVERLSELGVALDTTYKTSYSNSDESKIQEGEFEPDGFINKLELDDMENRSMFATMNHIGFIPQAYQQSTSGYTTQVHDEKTNYLIPKFKYIYPVDFDGRHQLFMTRYKNGFKQPLYDEKDDASYITFRLGAEKDTKYTNNSEGRIRHFYKVPSSIDSKSTGRGNAYYMPLYNNSFYFYFGIKKGSTAIDKFNEMFYSKCFKNDNSPFSVLLDTRAKSYCPEAYINETDGYAFIRVNSDDIRVPFSYSLYDESDNLVIEESDMMNRDFVIGGHFDSSEPVANNGGKINYQTDPTKSVDTEAYKNGLTNQTYYLTLTDSDGRSVTKKVTLDMPNINIEYETTNLSSKFYDSGTTRIDYICNSGYTYYGVIDITGLTVDGHECTISGTTPLEYLDDSYKIDISGGSDVHDNVIARVTIKAESGSTNNCMCDKDNYIASAQSADTSSMVDVFKYDSEKRIVSFFVYQPTSFNVETTQCCPKSSGSGCTLIEENSTSSVITIDNAVNFNTYLNSMPTKFMVESSNFYSEELKTRISDLSGWVGVHNEESYKMPDVTSGNEEVWEDFVNINGEMDSLESKTKIIKMKFNSIFDLSNSVYVTKSQYNSFRFTSTGGIEPILLRNIAPKYDDSTKLLNPYGYYTFKDNGTVSYNGKYPNIVGFNYGNVTATGAQWNSFYKNKEKIGNYFAGFTNNASYVPGSNTRIDGRINIVREPSLASISPYSNNRLKYLGQDEDSESIDSLSKVYDESTQDLRPSGDITVRNVKPWLRALNIDRRYDFDFTILGPVVGTDIKLYEDQNKERVWRSFRISGFTYNGIEMSYDDEYNIISSNTITNTEENEETSLVLNGESTLNTRLEYSYDINSGKTKYNHANGNTVWPKRNFGYNEEFDNIVDAQIVKEMYSSALDDIDLRNFYWSSFNENRLNTYCTNQQEDGTGIDALLNSGNTFYVFGYPYGDTSLYNGDYDINNYPTKRFIDIGNIEPKSQYVFANEDCSYGIKANDESDGVIRCHATSNGVINLGFSFDKSMTIAENSVITYERRPNTNEFISSKADLRVKLMLKGDVPFDDFDIYTRAPILITVKDTTHPIDGITYIKTSNEGNEFGGYGDGKSLMDAIDEYELCVLDTIDNGNTGVTVELRGGLKTKNGKNVDGEYLYLRDNQEFIASNDELIENITFKSRNEVSLNNIDVFSIMLIREYQSKNDDYLTKHLSVVEFQEILDVRSLSVEYLSEYVIRITFNENKSDFTNKATEYYIRTSPTKDPERVNATCKEDEGCVELERDDGGSILGTYDIYVKMPNNIIYYIKLFSIT